jgi:hypothetical protein
MKKIYFSFLLFLTINNLIGQLHITNCSNLTQIDSNKMSIKSEDSIVISPAGPVLKSNVHLVDREHHLNIINGHIQIVNTKTGIVSQEFDNALTQDSNKDNRNIITSLNAKATIYETGYVTDSYWNNNTGMPITYFNTNWTVPSPPDSSSNQLIYLFNGLVTFNPSVILQPVLQWGVSPAGGGNYWSIANWYVWGSTGAQCFHGSLVKVNPGSILQGVMVLTSQTNDTTFNYISSFNGYPDTKLQVNNIHQLNWTYEALEVYYKMYRLSCR